MKELDPFELSESPRVGQWPLEPEILAREILRLVKNPRVQGRRTLDHVDVLVHHFHDVIDMHHACFRDVHFDTKEGPIFLIPTESSREQGGAHPVRESIGHWHAPVCAQVHAHLLYDFDAEKVQHVLNLLTAPRMRLTVLPHRNEFVCHDFRIVTPPSPVSGITVTSSLLLQEDETCRLWYKPDVDIRKPNLLPYFRLDSPALSTTPYHAVLTSLFVRYVKDTLTEMAYEAELAGMEYELGLHARARSNSLQVATPKTSPSWSPKYWTRCLP
ncbi:hypothetical protein PsorP6_010447 [Peronosclerospora sorghi]|uniref:Uncharacterized protein n=1 Tax=Peronosclerospora sorghi TaxID=230839 RepID=A0ACC0VWX0_9STRA|nr:hypothetical protein PsorP6_010447 [Peronosclerospora sorghi]